MSTSVPFHTHFAADVIRMALVVLGVFLVMVCIAVAIKRVTAPAGDQLRDSSPFALISYAAFATLPTWNGLGRFGEELNPWRTTIYVIALMCGVIAAFDRVTFAKWAPGRRKKEDDDSH